MLGRSWLGTLAAGPGLRAGGVVEGVPLDGAGTPPNCCNSAASKPIKVGSRPPVYFLKILSKLRMKKSFSFAVCAFQKYGF